ncbi:MAG: glycerate kinase, partial [Flavobacteriia bacterium]
MKIVVAPDKFKDSLTGFEFCKAFAEGVSSVLPDAKVIDCPLADGGDGTMKVVNYYLKGEKITLLVSDPLFRPVKATYLFSKKTRTAYIEMAEASGLHLLSEEERNCMFTTSFGTGELIKDALERGAEKIILGIGGSATNDLGIGMATALGYRFLDSEGKEVQPTGKNLIRIQKIEKDRINPLLKDLDLQ